MRLPYADKLKLAEQIRDTAPFTARLESEFVLTCHEEWEDAHKMIILNMLFAILRAA
jgi:hypothetical protein